MGEDAVKWGVATPDTGPPGPDRQTGRRGKRLRTVFFVVIVLYTLIAAFHVQILQAMGRMLVVEHEASESDLIVCLAGGHIDRPMGAADAYRKGLAPRIFIAPEELPEGYELLKSRGIQYPRSVDLNLKLLQDLGVPKSSIVIGDRVSSSTRVEAEIVRELVQKEKIRSLILVTSPTHSRRTYLTFSKIIGDREVRIQVVPTPYSRFRAEDWWKHRKYAREVILEYQKLAYYYIAELRS